MLFNSWEFIAFYILVTGAFFLLSHRYRIYLLLGASYYFYMSWRWEFGFLMAFVSVLNFVTGAKIAAGKHRGFWMGVAVVGSLIPLAYYKYGNFLLQSIGDIGALMGSQPQLPILDVILPVGISFFSFQALSYSIDIYSGRIQPERSLVKFMTFVAFFPQLVAGPIERSNHILPQLDVVQRFDYARMIEGGRLFIWGLFKKVVVADRLAIYVDAVYANPEAHSGSTLALATLFFAFQIYCDFSGYSDMAIGIARTMGINLMQNFNLPYLATSIADFWKRWHISLSTWFGDYVYKPLGGSRVSPTLWMRNILIVFMVSGLWHGASWTFVVWGAIHAGYYLIEYFGAKFLIAVKQEHITERSWYTIFKMVIVFVGVTLSWIFFRASSMDDALFILGHIFTDHGALWWGSSSVTTLLSIALIAFMAFIQVLQYKGIVGIYLRPSRVHPLLTWTSYLLLLVGVALFGMSSNAFIYFQF